MRLFLVILLAWTSEALGEDKTDEPTRPPDTPQTAELVYKADDALKLFGDGLKSAGNKLGLIANQGLPEMLLKTITNSFTNFPINNPNRNSLDGNIFAGFFRLLGFDTEKLQAIALNAVVFIAQMIGNNLTKTKSNSGKEKATGYKFDYDFDDYDADGTGEEETYMETGTPLEWVVRNAPGYIKRIMIDTQENNLSDRLLKIAQGESTNNHKTDHCLLHLLCRLEPVIKGMQDSTEYLFGNGGRPQSPKITQDAWSKMTPSERMFAYMPKSDGFRKQKKHCDQKLPPCERPS